MLQDLKHSFSLPPYSFSAATTATAAEITVGTNHIKMKVFAFSMSSRVATCFIVVSSALSRSSMESCGNATPLINCIVDEIVYPQA